MPSKNAMAHAAMRIAAEGKVHGGIAAPVPGSARASCALCGILAAEFVHGSRSVTSLNFAFAATPRNRPLWVLVTV